MNKRTYFVAPALGALLAVGLAGCGGRTADDATTSAYCPQPQTVGDAARLVRFKDGAGRDPRDVVFEATMLSAGTQCTRRSNYLEVDLILRIGVSAGPSVGAGQVSVPYFVRVVDQSGTVVQGQDFLADYKLSTANPRASTQEELTLRLPFQQITDVAAYRVAVGLKPTPQELEYNRRATAR
jgi:hypothetical protein